MNTAVPFQAEKPIFRKVESIADMALLTLPIATIAQATGLTIEEIMKI